jgi:hypothetical protein
MLDKLFAGIIYNFSTSYSKYKSYFKKLVKNNMEYYPGILKTGN